MITAILVPIVIFYFYWLTKKEMKKNEQEWLRQEDVPEEAVISGEILEVRSYKERFYYHRFNHVITLKIDTGTRELVVRKTIPHKSGAIYPTFKAGEKVHLFGNWKDGYFAVNRSVKQE